MRRLLTTTAIVLGLSVPASAVTFDLSTLNVTGTLSRQPVCPCYDATSGLLIFNNASASQYQGWTEGTDGSAATLYFMGDGRGNNGGKLYVPSGAPGFTVPSGQSIGSRNTQYTGDYAQSNGFPLYFWFGAPGLTSVTPATGVAVLFNGLDISGGDGITVTGYSDLGTTVADTFTISGNAIQTISLNWAGIEQISLSGGSGFYVNNIEANDAAPVPVALAGTGIPGLVAALGGMLALAWRRRQRTL